MKNANFQILVATDLSPRAAIAVDRAWEIAQDRGAALTILHVVEFGLPDQIAAKLKDLAEAEIRAHLSSKPAAGTMSVEVLIEFGKDWTEINNQAERLKVDLVILGQHHQFNAKDLFRGTTVERVVRKGNASVLVAKRNHSRYENILLAVDFSVYSRRAAEFALRFFPSARFHLIHAYDIPFRSLMSGVATRSGSIFENEQRFRTMLCREADDFLCGLDLDGSNTQTLIREGDPTEVIAKAVASQNADLLVLGTHGRTGVAHALLGSVAETFLNNPPCDVATVRAW